jgi:hypothetical protein
MSRKDYAEAARIIREGSYLSAEARALLVSDLVSFFAYDNSRFSPSKFRAACEPLGARRALDEARAGWVRASQQLELEAI